MRPKPQKRVPVIFVRKCDLVPVKSSHNNKVENKTQQIVERLSNGLTGRRDIILMSGRPMTMVGNVASSVGVRKFHADLSQPDKQMLITELSKKRQYPLILHRKNGGGWQGVTSDASGTPSLVFNSDVDDLSVVIDILDVSFLYRAFQYRVWTVRVCIVTMIIATLFILSFM